MKNRTTEQAQKHRDYMKEYYRKNEKQRKKNKEKSNKRGLEKIPCIHCEKRKYEKTCNTQTYRKN